MKTIRYDENHRINGDTVEDFGVVKRGDWNEARGNYEEDTWDYVPTCVKIGAELTLVSHEDVSPNNIRSGEIKPHYYLFDGPIGGNSNPDITRYHGWRGTWNDRATYAHGVHRVLKMRTLKNGAIAVTIGQDLHPEWP